MSKVLGIIAEYNPFHNGHAYHLQKAKDLTGASYTIAIISGNFTQRGSTSLVNKWEKAKMAISNGVDLVIELPTIYSTSSAENFADGAINILDLLGVVDYVAFGAEAPNISILDKFATVLYKEPKEYKSLLSCELDKGLSYPKARSNALMLYLNDVRRFVNVLESPNNILAIEYLKALKKYRSNIKPILVQRFEAGYNDVSYSGNIASATAVRNLIKNHDFRTLGKLLPTNSYSILLDNAKVGHIVPDLSSFEKEILYNLRLMPIDEIANLADISEGLEFAVKNAANSCNSIIEFLNIIKSKRYTNTRLQRILLYSLLNITKKDMAASKDIIPYIRVLGFNENGKFLLSQIAKANRSLKIVTSVKQFTDKNKNKNLRLMMDKDILATNVYTLGYEYDSWSNLDYTQKMIIM